MKQDTKIEIVVKDRSKRKTFNSLADFGKWLASLGAKPAACEFVHWGFENGEPIGRWAVYRNNTDGSRNIVNLSRSSEDAAWESVAFSARADEYNVCAKNDAVVVKAEF